MKKMLLATALALLITGCAQQTFTVQNKPAAKSSTKGNHHPSFLRFWNWAENCRCSQVAQKVLLKTETQQTFVNGLLGFITETFILRWKRVCINSHNNYELPISMTLYLHCSCILLGSFQLFL